MDNNNKSGVSIDKKINKYVFWPGIILLSIFILCGVFFQKELGIFLNKMLYGMAEYFGWYINLLSLLCLIIAVIIIMSKYGDIRIGGKDAVPDYKIFNWCAMAICGGIGTGLLFWAMGEPIYHFASPPIGAEAEPFSRKAGIFAVSQAMWNWSFIQYSMYSLCAIAFALVTFNLKKPLSFGSLIEVVFGRPIPKLEIVLHVLIIFCLGGAVANSMGVGLLQIGAGIQALFGIPQSAMVWLIIVIVMGITFIISCVSGIGNGLKKISSLTIFIFLGLLVFVIIFGDTVFISKISTEAVGDLFTNWAKKTVMNNTLADGDTWSADWIIQYWSSFIVYAPVIGMFLSRMAKGRTIRQFLLVNILVPSIFCCIWIGVFGGMSIDLQATGKIDIWQAVNELGMQAAVFQIIASLPLMQIVTALFLIAVCFSFSTLADPMAAVLATLSVKKLNIGDEAPKKIKIVMGVAITTISYILVASGGVSSVKGMFVIVGLPLSLVLILCVISAFKLMKKCKSLDEGLEDK